MRTQAQTMTDAQFRKVIVDAAKFLSPIELLTFAAVASLDEHGQEATHAAAQRIERQLDRANP